jgi:hypothetical protein
MRRRKLLVALAGLAVMVAAGAVVGWPRANRVTWENYDRIREGMTRAEVEAILGPPGDYRTGPTIALNGSVIAPYGSRHQGDWVGNEGFIGVVFDSGVVEHKYFYRTVKREQSPLGNLLWRAERQWHRWFLE